MTVFVYIACRSASSLSYLKLHKRAHLHGRCLSQQLDAIFVALKLQLRNRICKPGAIFSTICRRAISQAFRTCMKLDAILLRQKFNRVAATKIVCVNEP